MPSLSCSREGILVLFFHLFFSFSFCGVIFIFQSETLTTEIAMKIIKQYYHGAFARLVSSGGGAVANFALSGGRTFANPGTTPELLTRTWFPIRI